VEPTTPRPPRVLFVTGRLAEPALRGVVATIRGIEPVVAVLPITVAALMPPKWIARHLEVPEGIDRILLPGLCRGDLAPVEAVAGGVPVERGPADLRDLPRHFGQDADRRAGYGAHSIEILAEINHAPTLDRDALLGQAARHRADGADVIDVGCSPGEPWAGVGDAVRALRDAGHRVSIDSFDPDEVEAAVRAGAELVLSVNAGNRERAADWGVEVVAIPDQPGTLEGLDATVAFLQSRSVPFRIDPIVEPIGFGFAASLGRYLDTRRRHPDAAMLMGVGNLTELTDVDSAGVNVLLAGFCEELRIGSVLTTAVINWARSAVRELDLARRLVHHAVARRTLPKHLEPGLVTLRDPKVPRHGEPALRDLQRQIRDPNWRLFAEDGRLYALNGQHFLSDPDPFALFERMGVDEPSHAFYLGYELAKAKTALTLAKDYRQDQALDWGFLTEPEQSHRDRGRAGGAKGEADA
jgi:dihydropteroate synthase